MSTLLDFPAKGVTVPNHIAIIPDGNRRWARARGLHTLQGHKKGFETAVKLCQAARKMGIHTVTLWGFSTENWDRSKEEIGYLMKLYSRLIDDYLKDAQAEKVRLIHLGRKDRIPAFLLKKIHQAEKETFLNDKYVMNIAIDYGGHDDIIRAVKKMIEDNIKASQVDKNLFEQYLDTRNQPYPYVDLIIRTSGEQRTSGLLSWQSVYAETYWENDHFPDFTPEKLWEAILDYSRRRRRFGGNDSVAKHLRFNSNIVAKLEIAWWRLQNIPEGTKFKDYAFKHIKEQFGLSKNLTLEAGKLFTQALVHGNTGKWKRAVKNLKQFYQIIKEELKLPFEPAIVASLEVKLWKEAKNKESLDFIQSTERVAQRYCAEVYRVSLLQAAKAAHLRVLAFVEKNLAERGYGDHHWVKAENYLEKFYAALMDKVA